MDEKAVHAGMSRPPRGHDYHTRGHHYQHSFSSKKELYEYFTNLMKARVWRDESDDLFKKLKVHVQVFMNQLAASCHERVRNLKTMPDGQSLCIFRWTKRPKCPGTLEDERVEEDDDCVRQDDESVQAVRWQLADSQEQAFEAAHPAVRLLLQPSPCSMEADEGVFNSQLHRRARLLNLAFKSK
eukprot:CAMPEP_0179470826 /NCGR_PEP_ID=MMETSP0799-20121207/51181_1 /TAXON_ID=46947 /ORGANISM="Geminigera cryophila, Strain CCMP2564" /LENGTH=183 /DNA_ID=CAMNT_0021278075 /DNA_START=175 /DNA_END=723 /DNA_ORIENTATION=+